MATDRSQAVPLCDIQGSFQRFQPQIEAAISRVLASGQVILGPEVAKLEEEVADYCGVRHAVGCASGSDALLLALTALGIGPGDEVIMPPFTFFATAGAVRRLGARPVFVDIDPRHLQHRSAHASRSESPIAPRRSCRFICSASAPRWGRSGKSRERHGVPLIEDAAQAIGAEYRDDRPARIGAIGCFSFYPTKNWAPPATAAWS